MCLYIVESLPFHALLPSPMYHGNTTLVDLDAYERVDVNAFMESCVGWQMCVAHPRFCPLYFIFSLVCAILPQVQVSCCLKQGDQNPVSDFLVEARCWQSWRGSSLYLENSQRSTTLRHHHTEIRMVTISKHMP